MSGGALNSTNSLTHDEKVFYVSISEYVRQTRVEGEDKEESATQHNTSQNRAKQLELNNWS